MKDGKVKLKMQLVSDLLLWNEPLAELFVNYIKKKLVTFTYLLGCGMAAVIADRVFISQGDGDTGDGSCQCQRFQQILCRRASKDSFKHAENL